MSKTKRGKSDKDREKGDRAITSNVDKGIADSGSAMRASSKGRQVEGMHARGNRKERTH